MEGEYGETVGKIATAVDDSIKVIGDTIGRLGEWTDSWLPSTSWWGGGTADIELAERMPLVEAENRIGVMPQQPLLGEDGWSSRVDGVESSRS